MARVAYDLTGKVFGRLTVQRRAEPKSGRPQWECICSCGRTAVVAQHHLRKSVQSCGCLRLEACKRALTTHGASYSGTYRSWAAAKKRCHNPNDSHYGLYGGRGIRMCEEWRDDFAAFLRDMGPRPDGYSIDRIDSDGPYAPGNCRWVPTSAQAGNRRMNRQIAYNGETHNLAEWARISGVPRETLKGRFDLGWSAERAFTTPVARGGGE